MGAHCWVLGKANGDIWSARSGLEPRVPQRRMAQPSGALPLWSSATSERIRVAGGGI